MRYTSNHTMNYESAFDYMYIEEDVNTQVNILFARRVSQRKNALRDDKIILNI